MRACTQLQHAGVFSLDARFRFRADGAARSIDYDEQLSRAQTRHGDGVFCDGGGDCARDGTRFGRLSDRELLLAVDFLYQCADWVVLRVLDLYLAQRARNPDYTSAD